MSTDEIRNQKALSLLEFREAEEEVARLLKVKERLAVAFHSIGSILDAANTTEIDPDRYRHITIAAACEAAHELLEARKQLAEAAAKKTQFGL